MTLKISDPQKQLIESPSGVGVVVPVVVPEVVPVVVAVVVTHSSEKMHWLPAINRPPTVESRPKVSHASAHRSVNESPTVQSPQTGLMKAMPNKLPQGHKTVLGAS